MFSIALNASSLTSRGPSSSLTGHASALRKNNPQSPLFESTPQAVSVKTQAFIQTLQRISGLSYHRMRPIQTLLTHYQTLESPILKDALYKKDSYFSRFFGQESWADWAEHRTPLGKIVAAYDTCLESTTRLELVTQSLTKADIKAACNAAQDLIRHLGTMTDPMDGLENRQSRRLTAQMTSYLMGSYRNPSGTSAYYGVHVVGSIAYVVDGGSGLQIIDVSTPALPVRLGGYDTSGTAYNVQVVGSIAYVADGGSGLQIIDVSTPASPVRLGGYDTSGSAWDVHVVGAIAYVADGGSGLQIIDVSTPASPVLLGGYDTSGESRGVQVVGSVAYIADYGAGLQVIDVSTPASPVLLGGYDTLGLVRGVHVVGSIAYIADHTSGLQLIDVSTPASPVLLGGYDTAGEARGVHIVGSTAYVADVGGGLRIVSLNPPATSLARFQSDGQVSNVFVSHPIAAVAKGYAGVSILDMSAPQSPVQRSTYDTPGDASFVFMASGVLFVADSRFGLHIVSILDPANPTLVAVFSTPGDAEAVTVSNDLAYVCGGDSGIWVINVTAQGSPELIGGYHSLGESHTVLIDDQLAYVADGSKGLLVLNVSDPRSIQPVAYVAPNGGATAAAYDVDVYQSKAYVAEYNQLRVIDVTNPISPAAIGSYGMTSAYAVTIHNAKAYVADYFSGVFVLILQTPTSPVLMFQYKNSVFTTNVLVFGNVLYISQDSEGLELLELTYESPVTVAPSGVPTVSPTRSLVTLLGSYPTPSDAWRVFFVGSMAYVADGHSGLQIFDVSNPALSVRIGGGYDTSGYAKGVHVVGTVAYVADQASGLQIIDVSNSLSPVLLGGYDTAGTANFVQIVGSIAYVADGPGGLQIIDVSSPSTPVLLGGYDTSGDAIGVHVVGSIAYVADGNSGLQIIDISNPASPVRLGGYDTTGAAHGVHIVGSIAYVADGSSGLQIIDVSNTAAPVRLGGYDTSGDSRGVDVVGTIAYVADRASGLQIINVSNPAIPVLLGTYDTPGNANGVAVLGNKIYIADGPGDLICLQADTSLLTTSPTVSPSFPPSLQPSSAPTLVPSGVPSVVPTSPWILPSGRYQTSGQVQRTAINFPHVYLADGYAGFKIIDAAIAQTPRLIGQFNTQGNALSVFALPGIAFIAEGRHGLQLIDISNPENPISLSVFDTPGDAEDVVVAHQIAYVSGGSQGVWLINVANRLSPQLLGGYDSPGEAHRIAVNGDLAYIADGSWGLQILNVSDAALAQSLGYFNTPGIAYDVALKDNAAYVADGAQGVQIVSVGNPLNPTLITTIGAVNLATSLTIDTDILYVGDFDRGLVLINIQNPSLPIVLAVHLHNGVTSGVSVYGNIAYISQATDGLEMAELRFKSRITVSPSVVPTLAPSRVPSVPPSIGPSSSPTQAPSAPTVAPSRIPTVSPTKPLVTLLGSYNTPGDAKKVFVSGSIAYVADGASGLQIIDFSNPGSPVFLGGYDTSDSAGSVHVVETIAYVADYTSGLQIIDVTNPATPVRLGGYTTSGPARIVQIVGVIAYVAVDAYGLEIIDVSNPVSPVILGQYITSGSAYGLYVTGSVAYVGARTSGLQIIDVSNPAAPVRLGWIDTSGQAHGVRVVGSIAYVADYNSGLQIIDVSNPTAPVHLAAYDTPAFAVDVQIVGAIAYVADGTSGLQMIDVSTPASPVRLGVYDTPGAANGVTVVGNKIYVADGSGGLICLQADPSLLTLSPTNAPTIFPTTVPTPFDIIGYVDGLSDQEKRARLANVTAIMTQLALESSLRSDGDEGLGLALSNETHQRLLNFSFAMAQLLLESQFRIGNQTVLSDTLYAETVSRIANISFVIAQLGIEFAQRQGNDTLLLQLLTQETDHRTSDSLAIQTALHTETHNRLSNVTAIMSQLALESVLRTRREDDLALALSNETHQRLLNVSFAMAQLLLESQFRVNNDTYLSQYFSDQLNATRMEFNQNIASKMAETLKNADTTASVLNALGSTLQRQIDTESHDRRIQDDSLFQFITNISFIAAHLTMELASVNGNVSLIHHVITNNSETTANAIQDIRQDLNSTRVDFNRNIADRMAESLKNADTTAEVLASMGNTLQDQINTEKNSRLHDLAVLNGQIQDKNKALSNQLYELGNMTVLFINELNASLLASVNHTDTLFHRVSSLLTAFSSQTAQRFMALSQELGNISETAHRELTKANASFYAYYERGVADQLDVLNHKMEQQRQSLQKTIDDLGLSDGNDYQVPTKEVTTIVTQQAAAIGALDNPRLQQIRRYFDMFLSLKEAILMCIFIFNAFVLINGMSILQSFHYLFALPKRRELDALRQGKTGPTGPRFDTFLAQLEQIIVEGDFSTDERLDRLSKLSQVQRLKTDSLRLFSSKNGPTDFQRALKKLQESCVVGVLRSKDLSSRGLIATNVYAHYSQWRRVNTIRTLIYSVLRPYTGGIDPKESGTLGRRETWQSRVGFRQNVATAWMSFYARIPSPETIKLPKLATPASLILKMHIEIDQQGTLDFSGYSNKMHSRACLLSHIPSIIQDLYCLLDTAPFTLDRAIQTVSAAHPSLSGDLLSNLINRHRLLLDRFDVIMDDIHQLVSTKSWAYSKLGLTRSSASLSESENNQRTLLAHAISENFSAICECIVSAIPLWGVWMTHYLPISTHHDALIANDLKQARLRMSQLTDDIDEYDQKYTSVTETLSTEYGLPGLIDLIDLCANLDLKSGHYHFSSRRKLTQIHPKPAESISQPNADIDVLSPGDDLDRVLSEGSNSNSDDSIFPFPIDRKGDSEFDIDSTTEEMRRFFLKMHHSDSESNSES